MCHIQRKTVSILTIPHVFLHLGSPSSEKIINGLTALPIFQKKSEIGKQGWKMIKVKVPLLFIASLNVLHNSIPVQFRSTSTGQLGSFQLHHKLFGALQLVQVCVPTDYVTKSSFRHSSSGLGSPQAAGFVGSSVVVCGEIPECYLVKCDPINDLPVPIHQ